MDQNELEANRKATEWGIRCENGCLVYPDSVKATVLNDGSGIVEFEKVEKE